MDVDSAVGKELAVKTRTQLRRTPMVADGENQRRRRLRATIGKGAAWVADWAARNPNTKADTRLEFSPLTPQFKADQHDTFVSHLNTALNDDGIRNIAVTGRYGAGKSSVLKEFARQNQQRVLFLSLSTLGPEDPDETRTNQIEKELVKQLLHREKPAHLPQSRYQRIERLPTWRAVLEAGAVLTLVVIGLWLFNLLPGIFHLRGDAPTWVRLGAGALVAGFVVGFLAAVRVAVHNRLVVSQVSAAGAAITLTNKSETYFDKYLDEIVYFFESRSQIDVVVFEDLDRFNHAGIFEALRELNTLLNTSKQITGRRSKWRGPRAIRFVYALRDSIFEQLGHDTKALDDDAAQAESVRANRTKFFDLVIPLVPFITHRTARELLGQVLVDNRLAPVPKVSDDLVDLVARHLPDMRLLVNIRNEYSIFAKRLITDDHGMDTLTANQLFALVVYKNLHLEDFELMLLGRSKLDAVYRLSRELVSESVTTRRARLRKIDDGLALQDSIEKQAVNWGQRLAWFFKKVAEAALNGSVAAYIIGSIEHDTGKVVDVDFWRKIFEGNSGVSARIHNYGHWQTVSLNMDELQNVIDSGVEPDEWTKSAEDELRRERTELLSDLEKLRVADFIDLAKRPDFTLTRAGSASSFSDLVADEITSELGRALITSGYIDRYYNMYAAQYYGERVPPNAMSYIVQHVDTNQRDINYPFKDSAEIAALLKETKRSFLNDVSAQNIGILDYLLETSDSGAHTVLDNVIRHVGEREREFLDAYLSDGTQAGKAVAYIAARWQDTFVELVDRVELAHDKRVRLVDIALANSNGRVRYQFGDIVRGFLQSNYRKFYTITPVEHGVESDALAPTDDTTATDHAVANAVGTLSRVYFECDDLAAVRESAMRLLVESDCYAFTSINVRTALDQPASLSLDCIRNLNAGIYEDALERPDEYLHVIESERSPIGNVGTSGQYLTRWSIESPVEFTAIVEDLSELDRKYAVRILRMSNPDCIVKDILEVPDNIWEALAECRRFPATLSNVDVYIKHRGEIDVGLAAILTAAESIALPEPSEGSGNDAGTTGEDAEVDSGVDEVEAAKIRVAEAVLNASAVIQDSDIRVKLAGSLALKGCLPVTKVSVEPGRLLGKLIKEHICKDDAATFAHFNACDWPALSYGIKQSANFAEFVTPELLDPSMTERVLNSPDVSKKLKRAILSRFDEFVPVDNKATLAAAGRAALEINVSPGASEIATIAQGTENRDLVVLLVHRFIDGLTIDEILSVLLKLAGPYRRLATSGEKLTFPRDSHHEAVLQRLKANGRINSRAYPKSLRKDARIEVEVLLTGATRIQ